MTGNSISLSPRWRQRGSRYAIRAGRNLPDKEFRYLRTVIVTAAVYRGFGSELAPLPLTFRHRAGVRPYTSPCGFAEPCVFSKQSPPPGLCHPRSVARTEVPLLPKLRGHFAEFLQRRSLKRLGMLYLPTCVGFGYGLVSGAVSWNTMAAHPLHSRTHTVRYSSPPPGSGLFTRFPSTTAFALVLGAGSPSEDYPGRGTLGLSARVFLTLFVATRVSIRTSDTSSPPHGTPSQAYGTLRYHAALRPHPQLRCMA